MLGATDRRSDRAGASRSRRHKWTGLPARAVEGGKISKKCQGPPAPPPAPPISPGCKTWDGKCVNPYPGNEWQHPKIHQSPDCLHLGGWHDVSSQGV